MPATSVVAASIDPAARAELEAFAVELGLGERLLAGLLRGEIVAAEPRESSDELVLSVAMLVDAPVPVAYRWIGEGALLDVRGDIARQGLVGTGERGRAALADARIETAALERLERVAQTGRADVNLSAAEVASLADVRVRFQSAGDVDRREALGRRFREILIERTDAYRRAGLAGVAPYARPAADGDPADALARATAAQPSLLRRAPDLERALGAPAVAGAAEHEFRWLALETENQREAALSHRVRLERPGVGVLVDRHFYVSGSYDAQQTVAACVAIGGRTLVFYVSRTFTDRARGLGLSLVYMLGRGKMRQTTVEKFEAIRTRSAAGLDHDERPR